MIRFFQIYKKAFAFNVLIIVLGVGLSSCVSKTTDLFLNTKSKSLEDKLLPKPVTVSIDKSCTYYLGVFSAGEYDKFDSNIYDQLRGSLFSEARYNYSDYDIHNLSQSEQGGLFKTVYRVEADLVLREVIRDKMNLIVNHTLRITSNFDSTESITETSNTLTLGDSNVSSAEEKSLAVQDEFTIEAEKPLALKEGLYSEEEKLAVLLEKGKNQNPQVSTAEKAINFSSISTLEGRQVEEVEVKVTDNEAADLDYTAPDSLAATATSAQVPDNTTEYKELEQPELTEMTGKTVYIVACFQKASFIEEKVWITQEEIGHPLKFYVTDKWVRVYLNDVRSLLEAKAIYYESWPCRYGE